MGQLGQLVRFRPPDQRAQTLRFPEWSFFVRETDEPAAPRYLVVGRGDPELIQFDAAAREAAIRWLASDGAAWLDVMAQHRLAARGLVPEPASLPDDAYVESSFLELLSAAGDLGLATETLLDNRRVHAIAFLDAAWRLSSVRSIVLLALAFRSVEKPTALFSAVESEMAAGDPSVLSQLREFLGPGHATGVAFPRLFMLAGMDWLLADRLFEPESIFDPLRVVPGPLSPLLDIWLVAAVSVGAIVPPYPLPGVFRCEYHLCGKVFVSNRRGVVGHRRFCCPEHGKRFYAARRMKEKAARTRNASQTPEE